MGETPVAKAVKTTESSCSECGRETRHYVRAESKRGGGDEEFSWGQTSYFLECAGCGWTSIRKVYWDDNYSYPDKPDVKLLPPGLRRRKPEWLWQVDSRFRQLFDEVYAALDAGTLAVPVMGARAILDLVIQDRVRNHRTFAQGLDALTDKGFISKHDRGILDAAVEAGNAAAHRGFFPTEEHAHGVVEIVEHVVSSLYVLKAAAKGLKKATPKRRRRRQRKTPAQPALPAGAGLKP
jgi:hypothetical protein